MLDILFPFIGGIGLFLIGMMLLSDGLVALAGNALKRALVRFAGTPYKAFTSGTLITALIQSSTATTVTLIGFVSAGLITLAQAIGVVIGASLGNTATGWIVAGLGLRIDLGYYTLPMIGIGALIKLLIRGRWSNLGLALAGFGLLFLGLDTLQDGMSALASQVSLAELPVGGYGARLVIMLIGLVLTAIMQSSSAAIATTLTALHSNAINFDQAAAMVVGASIGTTLTGALVTIGGSISAKRTALAHILFNLVTGIIAIALMPGYTWLIAEIDQSLGIPPGALGLALFHTLFIGVGVVLILPWSHRFARLIERVLPDSSDNPAQQYLDDSLLSIPAVALEASQRALEQITDRLLLSYQQIMDMIRSEKLENELAQMHQALNDTFEFVTRIQIPPAEQRLGDLSIAQLHAIDHLLRLRSRLTELVQENVDFNSPAYQWALEQNRNLLNLARSGLATQNLPEQLTEIENHSAILDNLSHQVRHRLLQETTSTGSAAEALRTTDAFRSLERTGKHIARICHYLALGRINNGQAPLKESAPEPIAMNGIE